MLKARSSWGVQSLPDLADRMRFAMMMVVVKRRKNWSHSADIWSATIIGNDSTRRAQVARVLCIRVNPAFLFMCIKNITLRGNLGAPYTFFQLSYFEYFKYLQAARAGRMESTCGAGTRMPVSISTRRPPLLTQATPYAYKSESPAHRPHPSARITHASLHPDVRHLPPAAHT